MLAALGQTSPEEWNYAWDYTMGAPDTALWEYPIDREEPPTFDSENGLRLLTTVGHVGLRNKNAADYFSQKATYEVKVKAVETSNYGFRVLCAAGVDGVADGRGLQVTLNGGYVNVLTRTTAIETITGTAPISYDQWHTVRLELNIPANANKVYLDGALVATVVNADLSTNYAKRTWIISQTGDMYVKSVRYRKEA